MRGTGNLEGKLVKKDFWPSCFNCKHYNKCLNGAMHLAFPHNWHWVHEGYELGEAYLVTKSWIGTRYGSFDTSCHDYEIDEKYTLPLTEKAERIFELAQKLSELDRKLNYLEKKGIYDEKLYDEWNAIFSQLEEELKNE